MPGHKGPFINDAMQEGGGGMWFCDGEYEDVSKTPILAWQRWRGVNFKSKLRDVIYECSQRAHKYYGREGGCR